MAGWCDTHVRVKGEARIDSRGKQAYKINKPHIERNRFGPKNGKKVSENRRYKLKLNRVYSIYVVFATNEFTKPIKVR